MDRILRPFRQAVFWEDHVGRVHNSGVVILSYISARLLALFTDSFLLDNPDIFTYLYMEDTASVKIGKEFSDPFETNIGVRQGCVLSPLLFIIVLEALSRDFTSGGALGTVLF